MVVNSNALIYFAISQRIYAKTYTNISYFHLKFLLFIETSHLSSNINKFYNYYNTLNAKFSP